MKSRLYMLVLILGLGSNAHAFYNPSTGRWLSRDPTGEDGGENLYSFSGNDSLNYVDSVGLERLKFSSEGKVYYDGRPWPWVSRDYDESGKQSTASAYFYQVVIEDYSCPGGTCNSGGSDKSSSFIRASVKNISECSVTVDCECNMHWFVSNYSPTRVGRKGVVINGTVLGHSFEKTYLAKRRGNGYLAFGTGDFSKRKTFSLAAGSSEELYYGIDVNNTSSADNPGAGWTESMSGDCSCIIK